MRAIISACAKRPVAVVMALLAAILAGALSAANMALDRLPPLEVPRIVVEAPYPGMGAAEVRAMLTQPLEDALASVKGAAGIRSVSRDGRASVVLDFRWGEDGEGAASRVREAVDAVYPALPEGAEKPIVLPFDPGAGPLLTIAVESVSGDAAAVRRFAEYELRSRLRKIEGAGTVAIVGGAVIEAAVEVDLARAALRGMTTVDVANALAGESADIPAGTAVEGDLELTVVAVGRPSSVPELGRLTLGGPTGPFALSEIARTSEREAPKRSVFIADGRPSVALEVYRRPLSDPVSTSRRLRVELDRASSYFSRDFKIEVLDDASIPIARSITDLALSALFGAFSAAVVLILFLRDAKTSILIALTFPLSAAAAISVLAAAGRTLNGMSLGGIALGVGLVSDNAVVVLDLLSAAFASGQRRPSADEVAKEVGAVATSTLSGVLTTAVVFVPVLFLPGPLGAIFGDLALSVIAANSAGWLVALFALPALYRALWRPAGGTSHKPRRARRLLETKYRRMLRAALRRPVPTLLLAALFAIAGAILVLTRETAFLPVEAAGELRVEAIFPAGTDLRRVERDAASLSAALASLPQFTHAFGRAGAEQDDAVRRADPDYVRERFVFRCPLRRGIDPGDALSEARRVVSAVAIPDIRTQVAVATDPAAVALGLTGATTLAVRAENPEEARSRAAAAETVLKQEAGPALLAVELRGQRWRPEIRLIPDREAAASLGVSLADSASAAYAALEGGNASRLEIGGRLMDVRVLGSRSSEDAVSRLRKVPVVISGNGPIPASAIADVERTEGRAAYFRLDRQDAVYLDAFASPAQGRALAAAAVTVSRRVQGAERADESAFRRYSGALLLTVALVLLLLYLTLAAQFESFSLPVLLLTTLPLSLAGAGPALLAVGAGLDSGSVLGLVVLFGTAVNGAIVLYETSRDRVWRGQTSVVAAYAGAIERARPVLFTTITTVVALIPVVLSPGGAAQRSMSAAMVGGMLASTGLTLFVAPLLFVHFLSKTAGSPASVSQEEDGS